MWSLVCSWDGQADTRDGAALAGRVADTLRAVHLLAGRARLWQDWSGSRVETLYDAHTGTGLDRLRALAGAGSATLHSAVDDESLDGPSSTLWLDLGGRAGSVEWSPLDLTDRVLGEPAVARAVLVSIAGIWDADRAAWTRSDVDALRGSAPATGGWMAYRAGATANRTADRTARPVLRGALTGPAVPAAEYDGGRRAVLAG